DQCRIAPAAAGQQTNTHGFTPFLPRKRCPYTENSQPGQAEKGVNRQEQFSPESVLQNRFYCVVL
ncbi:MAG TPA: hypothetical protein VGA63_00890, partial [Geopsychrobacteraceae bacterium]